MIRYKETDPEKMEAPCLCDCGQWFDLTDGYGKRNSNTVICAACHEKEEEIEEIELEIDALQYQPGTKRQIKKLQRRLEELNGN